MKRLFIILIIVLIFGCTKENNEFQEQKFETKSTGSFEDGDVSIDITPTQIGEGKLEFSILVNTHSVNLEPYNLKEITTLEINGKKIKPDSVPILGSHHSGGLLIFKTNEEIIGEYSLVIEGIPKMDKIIFTWN